MRRAAVIDVLLLCLLGPMWCAFSVLHVALSVEGRVAWVPIYFDAAATPADSPRVAGFWSVGDSERQSMRVGDRVLTVGDRSMRGGTQWDVVLALYDERGDAREVPVHIERDGEGHMVAFRFEPIPSRWRTAVVAIGMGCVGFVALWRGRGRRETRALALATLAYSFHWLLLIGGPPWMTRLGFASFLGFGSLFAPLTLAVPMVFPADRAIRSAWPRIACWAFVAIGPLMASMMLGAPLDGADGARWLMVVNAAFALTFLALVARAWLGASALSRRQIKWVLLGCYLGLVPVLGAALLASTTGGRWWMYEASLLATIAIPIALLIAMLYYDFMDVDRLITASATFTVLVALVGAPLPTIVPSLSSAAAEVTSLPADYFQTTLFFVLLIGAWRAEGAVRPWIDRLVFRETRAYEDGLERLKQNLDTSRTPSQILLEFGRGVCEVMNVERAALYADADGRFAPIFEHGRRSSMRLPTIDGGGALARWITGLQRSRSIGSWRRLQKLVDLDAAERAVLDDLDVSAIVPCRRESRLEAFLVLGSKRSGDVLTATELARLDSVSERLGIALERFEREQLERDERELAARMLAYAPHRLIDRIREGREDEAGEREVSVLFVDIRGMSSLAEQSAGGDLFKVIDGFTRRAAELIGRSGGMIVEFQGDCLMAVYGAPAPHPAKERAAVESGIALIREIGGADFERIAGQRIEVRVGIATGVDFVGSIDCVERRVWTAVGNTSNLAARLEGEVSRALGLPLVLDEATWLGASRPADFTRHADVTVRGRARSFVVYAADPRGRGPLAMAS